MKLTSLILVSILVLTLSSRGKAILSRDKCRRPITAGRCFGNVPSFAYNPITGKCEEFIYGGCGGNENRFDTTRECEKTCRGI